MRPRKLVKTITYRLPVFLGAVLIPRIVYGVWDFSPLVFGMAVGFTIWYYVHEAFYEGIVLPKFWRVWRIPKVCPRCGRKVTKDNVKDYKKHGIFCYFCAWNLCLELNKAKLKRSKSPESSSF